MSPQTLLAHWRDRWDKPTVEGQRLPYVYGKAKQWSDRLAHAQTWSRPALCAALAALGLLLFLVILRVRLSPQGQIVASGALFGVALIVRRYGGLLATLLLLWLSLCVSGRYLLWRFSETLGGLYGIDYVAAFLLCAAELYLTLQVALTLGRALWPATRPVAPLTGERALWPEVDVVIICAGEPAAQVAAACKAALALDWPKRKRTIHLLDSDHRPDISTLATGLDIAYLVHPGAAGPRSVDINPVLALTRAELLLVLECAAPVPPGLLTATVGAFVHSPAIAMLQSPAHVLAPPPSSAALAYFAPQTASFALLRRHALNLAGGVAQQPANAQPSIVRKLHSLGFACCYAGHPAATGGSDPDLAQPEWVRLARPFSPRALRCQRALAELDAVLGFYSLAPRCVFWAAPLLALLAGTVLIHAPAELLAAFLLPHLAHGAIAMGRMRTRSRLGLVTELRETLLAFFMLLPTTASVVRTLVTRRWRAAPADRPAPFATAWQGLHALLVLLHLAALAAGLWALPDAGPERRTMVLLAMLWCGYHLLLLASMLAVSEEARQIALHLGRQAARPAMLTMPLGRTLHCKTLNFPDPCLMLRLPLATPVQPGSTLRVTLFDGDEETTFDTRLLAQDGFLLRVEVAASVRDLYHEFGARALARGRDWPAWLPGRNADHPLPAWITQPAMAAVIAVLDFATHGRYLQWLTIKHWTTLWKTKNEQAH